MATKKRAAGASARNDGAKRATTKAKKTTSKATTTKAKSKATTRTRPRSAEPAKTPTREVARETFLALKGILERHARSLVVTKDDDTWYYLDTASNGPNGKPLFFGAVRAGKSYTSFYLMPVYASPKLLEGTSAALKKRMQGKSCFNLTAPDPALLDELRALTDKCFGHWKAEGVIR